MTLGGTVNTVADEASFVEPYRKEGLVPKMMQ